MKTADAVLSALSKPETADGFISGEALAERSGVSRQAVWKAVKQLRLQGTRIEAVTNRGYRLTGAGGLLSEKAVASLIDEAFGARVYVYQKIDSTNTEAKRRLAETSDVRSLDHTVIVASSQTAGRGRLGRAFYSPDGSGLYLSIIYAPKEKIESPALLTATAAVGVCRALLSVYEADAKIKWVNDIFMRGKKVSGILTEGLTDFERGGISCAVVGIGVNIAPQNFPRAIADIATSVLEDKDADTKRSALAAAIVNDVLSIYDSGKKGFVRAMEEYRERSMLTGKTVTVHPVVDGAEAYEAEVLDVGEDAKLIVKTGDGKTRFLDSGEVTLHSH
ncbi:biotin--[acetyl-CoA-carboxylase] ligase [Treponema sp. Marseille-Q4130]|uniref:biotin--[acetyl-CoA-carboxylase] ligase n=1 Tax=Treponema sp. Marseille-Q4130 TaxID=2766702 RepID=UPI001651FD5F|nr:biotin--[acetyl-CoA-carboxylase] ligase [Treponema sp. Marseille-Q4130]MBC6719876.1 biotin--[acetyl-CoA-carboxylase] ligase [Treponema sp. Marseille-Q4130]